MNVVEVSDLRKSYRRFEALRGVSLGVAPGEVFGLLGQNGAGKTTLIKILLGIARPTQGRASLLGEPVGNVAVRRRIGYLPEDHNFPLYHSAWTLLDFYGQLLGLSRPDRHKRMQELLELVGLKDRMHNKIKTYSKGMKQRVGIAQALFHDPEVVFLDEPTDGIDPIGRKEIRTMIEERRTKGTSFFINSHLLGEIELLCDRVAIMHKGEILRQGAIAEMTQQQNRYTVGLADNEFFPDAELRQRGYEVVASGMHHQLILKPDQSIDAVLDYLRSQNLHLRRLVETRLSLEDTFLATVQAHEEAAPKRRKPSREEV